MRGDNHKRIVLGIGGGIAAYKTPILARELQARGAEVRVVMTRAATEFITPLTLQAISGHPVHQHLLDADAEHGMGHIELARWAEEIVIAPATANRIARLAHGLADDLLGALVLATTAKITVAPAMNRRMWENPATQENLAKLKQRGICILGPAAGDQACGETGLGRMLEPRQIAAAMAGEDAQLLRDAHIVITAGPTWEAMDPVRGVTNHSSGKMGYALARAALDFGAQVTLISGRVHLQTPRGAARVDVVSAREMLDAALRYAPAADMFIAVAAVADYRPRQTAARKIKKDGESAATINMEFVRNPDILATVASLENGPFTVGFAAETESPIANARRKLIAKGADVIAVNRVGAARGFGTDENALTLLYQDGGRPRQVALARADKYILAARMLEHIAALYKPARDR